MKFDRAFKKDEILNFLKNFLPEDTDFYSELLIIDKLKCITQVEKIAENPILNLNVYIFEHNQSKDLLKVTKEIFSVLQKINSTTSIVISTCPLVSDYKISLVTSTYELISSTQARRNFNNPKRRSFKIGPYEKTFTPSLQLIKKGRIKNYEDLCSRFDLEVVTNEFFDNYKNLYLQLVKRLNEDLEFKQFSIKYSIDLNLFAKNILGQIVFCYFLQKMNILGAEKNSKIYEGYPNFLRMKFQEINFDGKNYYNDFLEYLFYEGLNQDNTSNNNFVENINSKVPFLNGGLFEPPANYDWKVEFLNIPNDIFSNENNNGILDIFDLYNFTVDESSTIDSDLAVDPEMLGKVFENLIEENIKKQGGIFYTHRNVVAFMCNYSLSSFLSNKLKLDFDKIYKFISHYSYMPVEDSNELDFSYIDDEIQNNIEIIDSELKNLKICDPAVGSGAFPVGMMQTVTSSRVVLSLLSGNTYSVYDFKNHFIKSSLHGIDIDSSAVEITKLRLWLSLIVQYEDLNKINTLPNLQYRVVQGDSLINTYEGLSFDYQKVDDQLFSTEIDHKNLRKTYKSLIKTQDNFYKAVYKKNKSQLLVEVKNHLIQIFNYFLDISEIQNPSKVKSDFKRFVQKNIFEDFFPWKLFFADTFDQNRGFDIIIGNPPYLESRHEDFLEEKKIKYLENVDAKYGEGTITRGSDLLTYFFPLALNYLNEYGVNCYITQNSWLATDYGIKLQKFLSDKFNTIDIIDSSHRFFSSGGGPNINALISVIYNKNASSKLDLKYSFIEDRVSSNTSVNLLNNSRSDLSKFINSGLKWGILFDSETKILDIFDKFRINDQLKYKLGQGLNISRNHILDRNQIDNLDIPKECLVPFINKSFFYSSDNEYDYIVDKSKIDSDVSKTLKENDILVTDVSTRISNRIPTLYMPRGIGEKYFTSINNCGAFTSSCVEVYLSKDDKNFENNLLNIWAFCNSSIFFLFREISGRKNLGGGLLKAERADLLSINLLYDFQSFDLLKSIYDSVKDKEIQNIDISMKTEFHIQINKVVNSFFGVEKETDFINSYLLSKVNLRQNRSTT